MTRLQNIKWALKQPDTFIPIEDVCWLIRRVEKLTLDRKELNQYIKKLKTIIEEPAGELIYTEFGWKGSKNESP